MPIIQFDQYLLLWNFSIHFQVKISDLQRNALPRPENTNI